MADQPKNYGSFRIDPVEKDEVMELALADRRTFSSMVRILVSEALVLRKLKANTRKVAMVQGLDGNAVIDPEFAKTGTRVL